jgi:PKD repeat protein
MQKGANGLPDPTKLKTFVAGAATPVDLEIGPNGDLFYVDISGGTIRRIQYSGGNQPPVADATANRTSGPTPLSVSFDGTGSSDPDGDTFTYAWDLDGDGSYDDSTSPTPTYTYSTAGAYDVGLRVTDARGASDTLDEPLTITAGNSPPTATIDTPLPSATWKVNEEISFSGKASDGEDGALPASALSWEWIVHHCPTADTCHEHVWQNFPGVASGIFTAPDHEYPSYLELKLTATDSGGLTDTKSVRLDPRAVELSFRSVPAGLKLVVGGTESTTPFSRTVIVGSKNSVSAPSPQVLDGTTYNSPSWSDGGAQSHDIVAPADATTYTATYAAAPPPQDTTPPNTTISSGPSGTTKLNSATFSFSGTDNVTPAANLKFECKLDSAAFSACSAPNQQNYTGLAKGSHTFSVRAKDAAGNIDASPASRTWKVVAR